MTLKFVYGLLCLKLEMISLMWSMSCVRRPVCCGTKKGVRREGFRSTKRRGVRREGFGQGGVMLGEVYIRIPRRPRPLRREGLILTD